ncbi:alpha/beta hydrolase [Micromonospora sp. CPCC 205371]|nr:alpha/beta hydrolase [Micromonospora sp. CPCC 205371]
MFDTTERHVAAVRRGGVRIAYEVAGSGPTVLLLPAWMISNRRMWSAQVAGLCGGARVVTYDARGSGESDRPADPAAYDVAELVADTFAVLDATGTDRAVLVGNSLGGLLAFLAAAQQPERVAGLVLIAPSVDLTGGPESPMQRAAARFDEQLPEGDGWARYNRHAWQRDFPGFVRWFVETALGAEASAEVRAEGLAQGLDATAEVLAATVAARGQQRASDRAAMLRGLVDRITCPVLVVHGTDDAVNPPAWSEVLAVALRAEHVPLVGAGHCPQVTRGAEVTDLIAGFVQGLRR